MTPQEHAEHLAKKFESLVVAKYLAGQKEHGGHLWDVDLIPLLYEARSEAIDQFVYLQTAIDKLESDL